MLVEITGSVLTTKLSRGWGSKLSAHTGNRHSWVLYAKLYARLQRSETAPGRRLSLSGMCTFLRYWRIISPSCPGRKMWMVKEPSSAVLRLAGWDQAPAPCGGVVHVVSKTSCAESPPKEETCSMFTHRTSGSFMLPPNSPKQSASHHCCSHMSGCISLQLSLLTAFTQVQAQHRACGTRPYVVLLDAFSTVL